MSARARAPALARAPARTRASACACIASVLPTFRVFITTARALYLLNCGLTLFLIINNAVTWNYVTLIKQNKTTTTTTTTSKTKVTKQQNNE